MPSSSTSEELELLKGEVHRSLRSFSRRSLLSIQAVGRGGRGGRQMPVIGATQGGANADPVIGTGLVDNERRARALAKEIKRLITEDKRRGIGV